MKKLLKKINVLGLGLILAGGLVITVQSAFKTNTSTIWGFDAVEGWVDINQPLPPTGEPGTHYVINCDDEVPTTCLWAYPEGTSPLDPDPGQPPVQEEDGQFSLVITED